MKLIKRVEEQFIAPDLVLFSPWFYGLGQTGTSKDSGLDSDFCPGESSELVLEKDERTKDETARKQNLELKPLPTLPRAQQPKASTSSISSTNGVMHINFDSLGQKGPGGYGSKSAIPRAPKQDEDETLLQPNIKSMNPVQFKRYLEKLRKMRPVFLEYVRKKLAEDREKNRRVYSTINLEELSDAELIHVLGMEARKKNLHTGFLGRYTEDHIYKEEELEKEEDYEVAAELANKSQPIKKQPHKFGGLTYAMPTAMETFYYTKPAPGFVLQDMTPVSGATSNNTDAERDYIGAFAGLTVHLRKRDAGGAVPLYEPSTSEGINVIRVPDPAGSGKEVIVSQHSESEMRMTDLALEQVPRVVGSNLHSYTLGFVKLKATVAAKNVGANHRTNPEAPGSIEYNGIMPPQTKSSSYREPTTFMVGKKGSPLYNNKPVSSIKPRLPGANDPNVADQQSQMLLSLGAMLNTKKSQAPFSGDSSAGSTSSKK